MPPHFPEIAIVFPEEQQEVGKKTPPPPFPDLLLPSTGFIPPQCGRQGYFTSILAGSVAELVERLPNRHKAVSSISSKPGVALAYLGLLLFEVETGRSEVQGHP